MRIALFTDTYLPTVNGVARTLGRLVAEARRRGHEIALVSPDVEGPGATNVHLHHQLHGIPVPMYPELLLACPLNAAGESRIREFAPDLVHVATEATVGWSGREWALRNGVPLVTSFHTNFPDYAVGYGLGALEEAGWRYLQSFHRPAVVSLCPSEATRRRLRERGFHARWEVWSRGVDAELFSPSRRKEEVREALAPGAERILLHVGRLAPEKRCDVAIEAFRRIHQAHPSAALVFVGDGPDRGRLEGLAGPGVHFAGYRTGVDLAEAYASGDLFVFPSDTETFGNVVVEAMASGLPVIAAARGGVLDTVIPGQTGILCAPGQVAAFAAAIDTLLFDPPALLALSHGGRQAALSRSWDRVFDLLFQAYEGAMRAA